MLVCVRDKSHSFCVLFICLLYSSFFKIWIRCWFNSSRLIVFSAAVQLSVLLIASIKRRLSLLLLLLPPV